MGHPRQGRGLKSRKACADSNSKDPSFATLSRERLDERPRPVRHWSGISGRRDREAHDEQGAARSRWKFVVDVGLYFDSLFFRYRDLVVDTLDDFQPDVIHIISFGDAGILGAIAAHILNVPLVLSWHSNHHEFVAKRAQKMFQWAPHAVRGALGSTLERWVLKRMLWYFGRGDALLAPSPDLVELLETVTGGPTFYMGRGVNTGVFSPDHRNRLDDVFEIGFVGRLVAEKSVRSLATISSKLEERGHSDYRVRIVGRGPEEAWLRANVKRATLTGVLHGPELSAAYANFDALAFPSRTDTFGQVVQEAQSSGVPAVVTAKGGPQYLVKHGVTGYIAQNEDEFIDHIVRLKSDSGLRARMGFEARRSALSSSWDRTFVEVYKAYTSCVPQRSGSSFHSNSFNQVLGSSSLSS